MREILMKFVKNYTYESMCCLSRTAVCRVYSVSFQLKKYFEVLNPIKLSCLRDEPRNLGRELLTSVTKTVYKAASNGVKTFSICYFIRNLL